jgi:RNA polymerase sigma factor (sigma-70 family)
MGWYNPSPAEKPGMAPSVLRRIQTLAADGQGDPVLLARFLGQRDEAAFAALVERHGPMVLGVSRRVLHDDHAAEDVFQATFLVLARRANAIRRRESVGSWLHGVALRLAHKAKAQAARAGRRDARPAPAPPDPLEDLSWREVRQVLDDELRRLPERYRLPLVLCYLEGRTRDEAAAQLGWSAQRVKGQLERGRDRLRRRLTRRGVALSAALPASLLAGRAGAAVPPLLAVAVVPAALKFGSGQAACGASAAAVALANEGVGTMTPHFGKVAAALVLLTGLVAVGGQAFQGGDRPAPPYPRAEGAPAKDAEPPVKTTFLREQGGKPPVRGYHVKLEMTNRGPRPVWLLLGYYGDAPLEADGRFTSAAADGRPQSFTGKYFDGDRNGGKGKVVEIDYIGKTGFRAFLLPPRAAVTFDDFGIEAWSAIRQFEVWEASALRVNGRTPLQDWLPYPTMSDQQARIPADTDWGNLDWDAKALKSRVDYPAERVNSVAATVLRKWNVPITGLDAPRAAAPAPPTASGAGWHSGPRMTLADVGGGTIAFAPDGNTLVSSAKYPGKVQRWDATTGAELPLARQDQSTRYGLLGFDRNGEPLGYQVLHNPPIANSDSGLVLVNLRTGERRSAVEFSEPDPRVRRHRHVALSSDGRTLAVSEWPDRVLLFDVETARRLGTLVGGDDRPVQTLAFAPDGRTLVVSYSANEPPPTRKRNEVKAWDLGRRQPVWGLETTALIDSLAYFPDGTRLAAGGLDAGEVELWDAKTGRELRRFRTASAARRNVPVAVSPDGRTVAAGWHAGDARDGEGGVVLWDADTGREQAVLRGAKGDVWALAFSPDGSRVAAADGSKTLHVWRRE